jgi:hypothetical protein
MNKAIATTEIDESLEVEIGRNLDALKGTAVVPDPTSAEHEMTAGKLGTLFRQMTKLSMSEVDTLIDELQRLRTKLEMDNGLIERAIAQHSTHSQGVMQLTTVISDLLRKLPSASGIAR